METVTFRLTEQKKQELDRVAEERGFNDRSKYLRHLVREATDE